MIYMLKLKVKQYLKIMKKRNVVQQVETLKDQLEFFEFQINQEMLSNKPNVLTIEALMHSWLEQLAY